MCTIVSHQPLAQKMAFHVQQGNLFRQVCTIYIRGMTNGHNKEQTIYSIEDDFFHCTLIDDQNQNM